MELTQPSDAVVSWLSVAGDDAASSDGTALASSCGEDSDGECSLLSPPGPPSPTAAHVPGECPAAPLLDEVPPVSPRMREIYETLEVQPYPNVRSVLDAAAMPPHLFGRLNASVRAWALSASASSSSSHATALVAESAECGCFALATSAASSAMPACTPAPPIASDGWVSSASIEDAKIRRAIDDLLRVLPHSLLFSTNGSVPVEVQHENLIERLARFDAGSIRRGQSVWASWMSFCQRHSLPDFGSPFDGDLCLWFLREEDEAARRAAASTSSSRTGATVKHARACSLRWLNSAVGIPFRADLPTVRSASKPDRSREPSFVPMWDVAVLRHLLRIAVCYRGQRAQFFRSYAASAYVMGIASLRQVDALRSPPPTVQTVDGVSCLHSVAEFTKALSRASMRPMPWWIPTTSIDPDLDDAAVLEGLRAAFALLPCALEACLSKGHTWLSSHAFTLQNLKAVVRQKSSVQQLQGIGSEDAPLHVACRQGHTEVVQALLAADAAVNQLSNHGKSALSIACAQGYPDCASQLLAAGAEVNQTDRDEATALYAACQEGHAGCTRVLLQHRADASRPAENNVSPLYIACQEGHAACIRLLLTHGVDVNLAAINGERSALAAGLVSPSLQTPKRLIRTASPGDTPLYSACQEGRAGCARLLIAAGASIDLAAINGDTPMHIACQEGRDSCVSLLVASKAGLDEADGSGATPLYLACQASEHRWLLLQARRGPRCDFHPACVLHLTACPLAWRAGAALVCDAGTALQAAHKGGNATCVRLLLARAEAEARAAAAALLAEEEMAQHASVKHASKKLKPPRRAGIKQLRRHG
ncbi:MAG: hypothetical protein SGPRY_000360 [Prymnesium sp.]